MQTFLMKGDTQCFPSGFSLCKVSFSLPVGTLSLCVIAVSRLSLCDVLLLLCPHMRSSISKETFLSSPRVSFYQSLHRCCLHASELRPIRRRVRQALRKEERDKESKKNFTCSLLVCFNGWKSVWNGRQELVFSQVNDNTDVPSRAPLLLRFGYLFFY